MIVTPDVPSPFVASALTHLASLEPGAAFQQARELRRRAREAACAYATRLVGHLAPTLAAVKYHVRDEWGDEGRTYSVYEDMTCVCSDGSWFPLPFEQDEHSDAWVDNFRESNDDDEALVAALDADPANGVFDHVAGKFAISVEATRELLNAITYLIFDDSNDGENTLWFPALLTVPPDSEEMKAIAALVESSPEFIADWRRQQLAADLALTV